MTGAMMCGYCGKPMDPVLQQWVGGFAYHAECLRGPIYPPYAPLPSYPVCVPLKQLTEEDVRRIVREELERIKPKETQVSDKEKP